MASSRFGWESAVDGAAEGSRKSPVFRLLAGKVGKAGIVAAMSAVAIGIVAPVASASNEANWTQGCRGYWYDTTGHSYCQRATGDKYYHVHFDCSFEADAYHNWRVGVGYSGTFDNYNCIFSLDRTTVTYD